MTSDQRVAFESNRTINHFIVCQPEPPAFPYYWSNIRILSGFLIKQVNVFMGERRVLYLFNGACGGLFCAEHLSGSAIYFLLLSCAEGHFVIKRADEVTVHERHSKKSRFRGREKSEILLWLRESYDGDWRVVLHVTWACRSFPTVVQSVYLSPHEGACGAHNLER